MIESRPRQIAPLRVRGAIFDFTRTYVMGILNVTPDSFSDGGKFIRFDSAVKQAERMIEEGADFIDIGGESTRPGADPLPLEEELDRVLPIIMELRGRSEIPISIDTYKSKVAEAALEAGADMINDISGLHFDAEIGSIAARYDVPIVVMHIKGKPKSMQVNPCYDDLIGEIKGYLSESIESAVSAGVSREKIIIDPGIGFGKTFDNNFSILRRIPEFFDLGCPILIGASRKGFLGSFTGNKPEKRFEESIAASVIASHNGANIVRVHDVGAVRRSIAISDAVIASD